MPQTDTYIEKDADINDEIDKLRHAATQRPFERRDVIIVASVSCIYGLGSPEEYYSFVVTIKKGETYNRAKLLRHLVDMQYERNDIDFSRGKFRVRGDTLEIQPAYEELALRIEFFGDDVERIVDDRPAHRRAAGRAGHHRHLPGQALRHLAGQAGRGPSRASSEELEERLEELQEPGQACSRRRGWRAAPTTTWRCCRRPATAPASRTTRATCPAGRRAARRGRCSTTSRTISCCSSTSRT